MPLPLLMNAVWNNNSNNNNNNSNNNSNNNNNNNTMWPRGLQVLSLTLQAPAKLFYLCWFGWCWVNNRMRRACERRRPQNFSGSGLAWYNYGISKVSEYWSAYWKLHFRNVKQLKIKYPLGTVTCNTKWFPLWCQSTMSRLLAVLCD